MWCRIVETGNSWELCSTRAGVDGCWRALRHPTTNPVPQPCAELVWQAYTGAWGGQCVPGNPTAKKPTQGGCLFFLPNVLPEIFLVSSSSKVEYLWKATFQMNFPDLDSMVYDKSKFNAQSSSRDCFAASGKT